MKRLTLLAISASLVCCAALAAESRPDFEILAGKVAIDDSKEEVTLTDATMQTTGSTQIVAQGAFYQIGPKSTPRVLDLVGVQVKVGGQTVGTAESGVYYPELQMLTTESYRLARTTAVASPGDRRSRPAQGKKGGDVSRLMDLITYTCVDGHLYRNGEVVSGGRDCVNISGGGSHTLTCSSGGGGNYVVLIVSDQQCPIE